MDRFSAFWLQDSSSQFADLRLEVREDGAWRPVEPGPAVAPAVNTPREKTYRLADGRCRVELRNLATVLDTPPSLQITAPKPVDVRLTFSGFGPRHHVWLGRRRISAAAGRIDEDLSTGYCARAPRRKPGRRGQFQARLGTPRALESTRQHVAAGLDARFRARRRSGRRRRLAGNHAPVAAADFGARVPDAVLGIGSGRVRLCVRRGGARRAGRPLGI